jgi:hypothetical protein
LELDTFEPAKQRLPALLGQWLEAAGTDEGDAVWHRLRDYFLHQFSITDGAYAVLPHVVRQLHRVQPQKRVEYLLDLSFAVGPLDPHAPRVPDDMAEAYECGVRRARELAVELLSADLSKQEFRYLLCCISNLHGHPKLGQLLFSLQSVDSDAVAESGYA